jgi:uncharacterized Zn finger protein (UPF0148 family)
MYYCPYCGYSIYGNETYCPNCGQILVNNQLEYYNDPEQNQVPPNYQENELDQSSDYRQAPGHNSRSAIGNLFRFLGQFVINIIYLMISVNLVILFINNIIDIFPKYMKYDNYELNHEVIKYKSLELLDRSPNYINKSQQDILLSVMDSIIRNESYYHDSNSRYTYSYKRLADDKYLKRNYDIKYGPITISKDGNSFKFSLCYENTRGPLYIHDSANKESKYIIVETSCLDEKDHW